MLWIALAAGCAAPQDDTREARAIAERYYRFIQEGRFADAAALFPEGERATWRDFLQRTRDELGPLQSYVFNTIETHTVYSGRLYLFIMDTTYARGEASEVLTLKSAVSEEGISVVGHKIEPD